MSMPGKHQIGCWVFDVESAALVGPEGARKLEDRTARTLELLCRHRGSVISHRQILEEVWRGRAVSPNSVAVVIGDLRRALRDDARAPNHIETVSKRGYRLTQVVDQQPAPVIMHENTYRRLVSVIAVALVIAGGLTFEWRLHPRSEVLIVEPVANATGSAAYQPLTSALGELVTNEMSSAPGLKVMNSSIQRRARSTSRLRTLTSRLILWNGVPTLSMTVVDSRSHIVLWSDMAGASVERRPAVTLTSLGQLRARIGENKI